MAPDAPHPTWHQFFALIGAASGALLGATAVRANAADTVTIGAIGPAGDAQTAIETAAAIVDAPHPGLEALPLGAGQGLPHLGGAKIKLDFADDLGNPSVAAGEALRLITRDHVAALIGDGSSLETLAAAPLAERHGTPLLVTRAAAPEITAHGFRFVFRAAPLASDFARGYAQLLGSLKAGGAKIDTIALVFDDGAAGRAEADTLRAGLAPAGFAVADISYTANSADLSGTVTQLRDKRPDVAILVGRTADAILLVKTMQNAGYKPPIEIGDGAAFTDPVFVKAVGNLAQGLIAPGVWSADKADGPAAIVDELYRAKSGHDFDDESAQAAEGLFVLAEAIDRAGSAEPAAIQVALGRSDLKRDQLIVGYDGVKFDASGQNTLAATYLTQLQGWQYVTVWPTANAKEKLALPFRGWE